MSRWFRHYAGMMRDEKLVSAAIRSKQSIERVLWVWGAILESAAEINDDGKFALDTAEIAYFLRADQADIDCVVRILQELGRIADGRVGTWCKRQFASDRSADRTRAYRERQKGTDDIDPNVTPSGDAVTVTTGDGDVTSQERHCDAPETETETETETELNTEKKENFRPKRVRTDYPEDFEIRFWKPYPRTVVMSKSEAFKAWGRLSDEDRLKAIEAIPKYCGFLRSKPDHPAVHACRFLSQRRFDGFTADTEKTGPPIAPPGAPSDAELRERYGRQIAGHTPEIETAGGSNHVEKLRPDGAGIRQETGDGGIPDNRPRPAGIRSMASVFRHPLGRQAVGIQGGNGRENQIDDGPDAVARVV